MRLPKFVYVEPKTLREAIQALSKDPKGSVLLAGGTDLLVNMKHHVIQPKQVINLKSIPKLAYIIDGKEGVKIGPLTRLHDLALSPVIREKYSCLSQAAESVGAYAHQVMGTLAGNLCQGNRCRYYNQSIVWRGARPPCYKAGGKVCYVVPAQSGKDRSQPKCYSTYCGDMAPVLIALDSRILLIGPQGERILPLRKLYAQDGKRPLSLKNGEILREILLPPPAGKTLYLKWRLRGAIEFPVVSLALRMDQGEKRTIRKVKIVLSGVGSGPVEAPEAERMLRGATLARECIERATSQVSKEISPVRTSIASPAYKRKMAGVLLAEALNGMDL